MARRKDVQGRFVASTPGEDYMPEMKLEAWMNEFEFVLDSGAASNAAKGVKESTGLGVTKGVLGDKEMAYRRWTIFGGMYRPRGLTDVPVANPANYAMCLQVQVGDQAATPTLRDRDHALVLAEGKFAERVLTSGGFIDLWPKPLDIVNPLPMYAEDLTLVLNGTIDTAGYRNLEWLVTLFYGVAEGRMEDQLQYLQTLQAS